MDKAFDPRTVEPRWLQRWSELGVGKADADSSKPGFTIALPPPNITGRLHLGHAAGSSVQDALARYHRMRGDEVEWCPGTDHAAIATNAVIERQLAAEGTTKEALGRAAFHQRVDAWYAEYGGHILRQMRNLGFSCDWSRSRFTLDDGYVRAIRTAFKAFFDKGLIYRGPRIVNWCPRCQSAISDEEVDWQGHTDTLTHIAYPLEHGGEIVIATVRPETMLGDTAVAVAPGDARYAHLVGRTVVLPLSGRRVPIVEDSAVKLDFGTGALKVTPGHDPVDYEIGRRHDLPVLNTIAADGTMDVPELPQFHGMPAETARCDVTEALRALGTIVKEEPYEHEVGHCDRCGHTLEPLISTQWWASMKSLAEPGIRAVEDGRVRFHPQRYTDTYLAWMRNIRDWCISRQIWLGHAIPVSTCANHHTFAWIEEPTACPECDSSDLTADPDVLDTWFSSALWPFAIFGWPDATIDLERFYPTNVLVTDRGIINLWVARMIMTGLEFVHEVPFTDVLITSTIQAKDGSRMSKSKGNVIDPEEMIGRYGADAVRAWAVAVGTSGQDVRFDEDRIASYQRFANKIWNCTRFLVGRLGDGNGRIVAPDEVAASTLLPEDRWMLARTAQAVDAVDAALQSYRFHDAMDQLYDTLWHGYCDWYVEMVKPRLSDDASPESKRAAAWTLTTCLDVLLRVMHPFMPFITEECAQRIGGAAPTLQQREWPQIPYSWRGAGTSGVDSVLDLVQAIRAARQGSGVRASWKQRDTVVLSGPVEGLDHNDIVRILEALDLVTVVDDHNADAEPIHVVATKIGVELVLAAAVARNDDGRLARQMEETERRIVHLTGQLDNPRFVERARPEVVEATRRSLQEAVEQADALRRLVEPSR